MKYVKHTGEYLSFCSGCLVRVRPPLFLDSMLTEIQTDSGTVIGLYCSNCLSQFEFLCSLFRGLGSDS